jgi:hypothetical protein
MRAFVLDLLDLVEEKITEAEKDPASRTGALAEATGALPIIKGRLHREDQTALAQFMLVGFFDLDFEHLGQAQELEFANGTREIRKCIEIVRAVLQMERPTAES